MSTKTTNETMNQKIRNNVAKNRAAKNNTYNFTDEQISKVWKNEDATEVYNYLTSKEKATMKMAARDAEMGNKDAKAIVNKLDKEAASRFIENNSPDYIKTNDKSNNTVYTKQYQNAFAEYKKKHPNSKITLSQFVKMSEEK